MIQILIGGDVCPMGSLQNAFAEGHANEIFDDLLDDIIHADLSIVNLECPLVSQETPIAKAGPVLGAQINCVQGFVSAGWKVLNLANNHSFDHGARGLHETMSTVRQAGLDLVGAGRCLREAQTPLIKQINGQQIIIYSMAEREFSIADDHTPGANPLDLINFVNVIRQHRQPRIFIVLIHSGTEYYPYPSPEMVRMCRFMVDMGADAVICCHTHCPLPWEVYANKPIIYGLGNLIFESPSTIKSSWYEGYLARLNFHHRQVRLEVVPYFQFKTQPGAQKMDTISRNNFFATMNTRCSQLKDIRFLKDQWLQYCQSHTETYLSWLFAYNRPMHKLRKLLRPLFHSKEAILRALLLVQCESHREILHTIFQDIKSDDAARRFYHT